MLRRFILININKDMKISLYIFRILLSLMDTWESKCKLKIIYIKIDTRRAIIRVIKWSDKTNITNIIY